MLEIEIDGQQIEVPDGSTIMDAANRIGAFIPHFCYHKKLSIAANCRMCLVQVEKAPKPLPACATPVTNGMKVWTHSESAVKAQKGVMEFLLINHPLDCPICDQGGECQLQDLAVGYGAPASRYREEKRVVVDKNLGPLIATDMTRCINCTRCVRFTQEIAGRMELGQAFRGERAEIMPFIEKTVNSELSGNVIDLCPVGALTSKPFRFSARTWELARRRSVSPHDSLGSNLTVQVKLDKVFRVLPLDNEEVNECWLADKDRFSYEGLNSEARLTKPLLRKCGEWQEVEWQTALEFIGTDLTRIVSQHGAQAVGALASPHATLEELYLLQKVMRGLGSDNIDFRLRQSDFALDGKLAGAPWLGMKIAEVPTLDRVLIVGSFLRKDHPLLAHRLRQAAKRGAQISLIHATDDDLLMNLHAKAVVPPSQLPRVLAEVVKAAGEAKGVVLSQEVAERVAGIEPSEQARAMAASLAAAENGAVFLGNLAQQHPGASALHALGQELARITGVRLGYFGEAANSVGGHVAGALPRNGLNARSMLEQPRKAYVLLNAEPELDCHNPRLSVEALKSADLVVALSVFKGRACEYAHVILPIAPFTETSGSFINTEGRVQSFNAVVRPRGETRPAWKVLRVIGNLLDLPGFNHESSEQVRAELLGDGKPAFVHDRLSNSVSAASWALGPGAKLERVTEVPIYFADPLVRRAPALQLTLDASAPRAGMAAATLAQCGVAVGERVRVRQGSGEAVLEVVLDKAVPDGCVRVAAAHPLTAELGDMVGELSVERA